MKKFWQKIMTHLEMRNFEPHYDPDETEMSAQERLLYNNNYNSNSSNHHHYHHTNGTAGTGTGSSSGSGTSSAGSHQHIHNHHNHNHNHQQHSPHHQHQQHSPNVAMTNLDEENHYQLPYAHLHPHQPPHSPYLGGHHPHHPHYHPNQQQLHQPPPPHLQPHQGSYSSGDEHSSTYGGGPRPPPHMNGHSDVGGNGTLGLYPHTYAGNFGTLQEKYSVAYPVVRPEAESMMGRRGNRNTGSGIVYRPRKRLWWTVMMLALILLILAGAVVIAVYFTVLKKDSEPEKVVAANGGSVNDGVVGEGSGVDYNGDSNNGVGGDGVTEQPTYNVAGTLTTPSSNGNLNSGNGINNPSRNGFKQVNRFEAYWHPGDSRLFSAQLANGTVVDVYGPKRSDGTVKSIYSLTLKDAGTNDDPGPTRFIRFQGGENIASVVLPNGVMVGYDLSAQKFDVDIKIFEPVTGRERGPVSYIATVRGGSASYPLEKLHKAFRSMPGLSKVQVSGRRSHVSKKCFLRFPLKVSKCGGGYPYDGAHIIGEISGIKMAALPWPKQDDDPCYKDAANLPENYYLPLPGPVDSENATMIKEAFVASSARNFVSLCDTVKELSPNKTQGSCSTLAEKVRSELGVNRLLDIVFSSCSTIFNALHTVCAAVNEVSASDGMPLLTESNLFRGLNRQLYDSFLPTLPEKVDVKAHAYCPSSVPKSSYEKEVFTGLTRGNVVQDTIHINCDDYPEVKLVKLKQALALSRDQTSFDKVRRSMIMCSICSFDREVSVQITKHSMLCNNTCTTGKSRDQQVTHIPEIKMYDDQSNKVYCSEFLTNSSDLQPPINRNCLSNCASDLSVRFTIKDPKTNVAFYDQMLRCNELKTPGCSMAFGTS